MSKLCMLLEPCQRCTNAAEYADIGDARRIKGDMHRKMRALGWRKVDGRWVSRLRQGERRRR